MKNIRSIPSLITDSQSLVSASIRGHSVPIYDDGFGSLFVWQTSLGNFGMVGGIMRAQTWEDAYSICEDEFFPSGDADASKEMKEINAMPDGKEKNHAQACFDESFGFRGGARRMPDGSLSHIYAKDLNGDTLDALTPELLAQLEIALEIVENE